MLIKSACDYLVPTFRAWRGLQKVHYCSLLAVITTLTTSQQSQISVRPYLKVTVRRKVFKNDHNVQYLRNNKEWHCEQKAIEGKHTDFSYLLDN